MDEMAPNVLLEDGRRPVYFCMLDLPSKPFWNAEECGAQELVAVLREHKTKLLEEVQCLRGHGKDHGNGWSVFTVVGDGKPPATNECPLLISILRQFPSCVSFDCPFQASLISVLGPHGSVKSHFGPTNFRLRLQFLLTSESNGCWLRCGKEESRYDGGFAIIDDSFCHSAGNPSEEDRIVLVIDLWHPGITKEERMHMEMKLKEIES